MEDSFSLIRPSNPGNKDIDKILPKTVTLKRLVIGCTAAEPEIRFAVEQALLLCKRLVMEYSESPAKPNPDNFHQRLERPLGMHVEGEELFSWTRNIMPPGVLAMFTDGMLSIPECHAEQSEPKDPAKERSLREIKELLGLTTAFDERVFRDEEWLCKDGSKTYQCDGVGHEVCKKTRRQLCDEIFKALSDLSTDEQYQCAGEMERFWKLEAPKVFGSFESYMFLSALQHASDGFSRPLDKPIAGILETFKMLVRRDTWHQYHSQAFGVWVLSETERGILPHWDTRRLLDDSIHEVDELRKLFTVRAYYQIVNIEGSRFSWFHLKNVGIFLGKNCSQTRVYNAHLRDPFFHETEDQEPLNNEQIRRALIEALMYFKMKIRNQPSLRECIVPTISANFLDMAVHQIIKQAQTTALNDFPKLYSLPDQPFPGYYFLNDTPPTHSCFGDDCGIAGGFPKTADTECRIPYHQCSTDVQKDYIKGFTLMTSAFKYVGRWRMQDFWIGGLLDALITEIEAMKSPWRCYFVLAELDDGSNALVYESLKKIWRSTLITKEMEILYTADEVKWLGLVQLRLDELKHMLIALRDHCHQHRWADGVDPEVMQPLIDAFWKEIMTTKLEEWKALPTAVDEGSEQNHNSAEPMQDDLPLD